MARVRKDLVVPAFAGMLSLSLFVVAGGTQSSETGAGAPVRAAGSSGGPGGPSRGGPNASNASGSVILQMKCGCHGPGDKGGRAPALTGGAGKADDELFKIIHDRKDRMPTFALQLTDFS